MNRLNVALTRARFSVVIFGDTYTLGNADDAHWKRLLEYCGSLSLSFHGLPVTAVKASGYNQISSVLKIDRHTISKKIGAFFGKNEAKCEHSTIF